MNRKEFEQGVKELLKIESLNSLILQQIYKFSTELGYTYEDIYQALYFYSVVEKNVFEIKYGIGIVPYVKDRAKKYFERIEREKLEQIKSVEESKKKNVIILEHKKNTPKKRIKKIDIENIDVN